MNFFSKAVQRVSRQFELLLLLIVICLILLF